MQLLERSETLDRLDELLEGARAGGGTVVTISGEAGIGKTSVARAFCRKHAKDARVLWGACDPLTTPRPLGPLLDVSADLNLDLSSDRFEVFRSVLEALQVSLRPTVLVIEDLQWVDEATLDLLKYLARRIQSTHAVLLVTYREEAVGRDHRLRILLGELGGDGVQRITLPRLTRHAIGELAAGADVDPDEVYRVTLGNPFFATEVMALGLDPIPATVRDAVLARAANLDEDAWAVLELAAVSPGQLDYGVLNALILDDAGVNATVRSGMLVRTMTGVSFRHELSQRTIEGGLAPDRRAALHRSILALLEIAPVLDLPALTYHAAQAGDADRVGRYGPAAADEASALGAHREAAAHLEAAVAHAGSLPLFERVTLLDRLSHEYFLSGHTEAAIESLEEARTGWRELGDIRKEGESLQRLSRLHWYFNRGELADRLAGEAIELLEGLAPGAELAMAYAHRAALCMLASESAEASRWADRAIRLAKEVGERKVIVEALISRGTARMMQGDAAGRDDLDESLQLAEELGYDHLVDRALINLSALAVLHRDYAAAERYIEKGLDSTERLDLEAGSETTSPTSSPEHYGRWACHTLLLGNRSELRLEQGRWEEAEEDARRVVDWPRVVAKTASACRSLLALLQARRGMAGAETVLREVVEAEMESHEIFSIGPAVARLAECLWLQGEGARSGDLLRKAMATAGERKVARIPGELALWLWRVGETDPDPSEVPEPYRSEILGDWRSAADQWEALGCPYEHALALAEGDDGAMKESVGILDELGAAAVAALVRRRLRERGATGIPRGPRAATRENPAGLTSRQLDVLLLLCEGMSNAEIAAKLYISPKTTSHHVSAVLSKLGVESRTQAVAAARRLGIVPQNGEGSHPT